MEYIKLNNNINMPVLGYGVYQISGSTCSECVKNAINTGYRLIDTAQEYQNEEYVGIGIKQSGIKREELFLTTKVWPSKYGYEETISSVYESLEKLGTDYLDLCLLHQPFNDYYSAYRALEHLYKKGLIKAIGVSNFYPDRLVDIASFSEIPPMVNQIEINPYHQRLDSFSWNAKYNTVLEAWAPFGEGRNGLFDDPDIILISKKYNKSTAQVILKWLIQKGAVVIPKTVHLQRMKENFDVFDFSLSDNDMQLIASLNKNKSAFFSHQDPETAKFLIDYIKSCD